MKKKMTAAIVLAIVAVGCSKGHKGNPHVVNQTYVHRYGVEVNSDDWDSRGKHGKVISKLDTGVTLTETYSGGVLDGVTSCTYPHSDMLATAKTYVGGVETKEVCYDISGNPKSETVFLGGKSKQVTGWYEDGTPQYEEHYVGGKLYDAEYYTADHKLVSKISDGAGIRIVRNEYGELEAHDEFQNGSLVTRTGFYPNGAPKEMISFAHDQIEGTVKRFLPVGEPVAVEQWVGGKQHGITTIFQNGEKFADVSYFKGAKHGVEKRYRNGVTLVEEISWVNDRKHGPSTTYIDDVKRVEWFYRGNPVTKAIFDLNVKRQGR